MAKDMTSGKPLKLIWNFTIPLLIGNLFQQLYNMADTFIVGRTIGVHALAAVGSTGSIVFLIIGFATGLTAGLAIPLAQRFGAKDYKGVKHSFYVSILISIATAIVLTALSMIFCRKILEIMQTPSEIIDGAYDYLIVIFGGIFSSMAYNLLSNIFRSIGDAKTPLYFLVMACVMNIVLDILFIAVFGMGVEGAGYATVLSQIFSAVACVVYIWKKIPVLRLTKADLVATKQNIREHCRISFPMAFQASIIAIGTIMVQIALNQLGPTSVAAHTAAQKIDQLAILPMMSFGVTMATYSAQNYGAKKYSRVHETMNLLLKVTVILSTILWTLFEAFPLQLIQMFGSGDALYYEFGVRYARAFLFFTFINGTTIIVTTFFPAIGKAKLGAILSLTRQMFVLLPVMILLATSFGVDGLIFAGPISDFISFIICITVYIHQMRKIPKVDELLV